jgi:hypothetical protein
LNEDIFAQIDKISSPEGPKKIQKPLGVVDASNVAMRHGKN